MQCRLALRVGPIESLGVTLVIQHSHPQGGTHNVAFLEVDVLRRREGRFHVGKKDEYGIVLRVLEGVDR